MYTLKLKENKARRGEYSSKKDDITPDAMSALEIE